MCKRLVIRPLLAGLLLAVLTLLAVAPVQGTPLPAPRQASGAAVLTNNDIIKMVRAKLGESLIVAKIKSSAAQFDTSTEELIRLKQAGVSDLVLQAMTEAGRPSTPATPGTLPAAPTGDSNDPLASHPSGIFYFQGVEHRMILVEPTVYSGTKTGGMFKTVMTSGIAKAKMKAVVNDAHATLQVHEARPTFYFYFNDKSSALMDSADSGVSNPNEFVLARMESKKDHRELVVGRAGVFGEGSGTESKDTLVFDVQKIGADAYRVQPRTDLEPGEYCFLYPGSTRAMGMMGGKLFAFGIDASR